MNNPETTLDLTSGTVKTDHANWAYLVKSGGPETWVCFAGYGQGARTILRFTEKIFPDATLIAVDLPAHGGTEMRSPHLTMDDIMYMLGRILRTMGITRVNILAYSMGGALALKCVELSPGQIDRVWLLAPDGLKRYPMRWFATNTGIGRALFKRAMYNPSSLFSIMDFLVKVKAMDAAVVNFFKLQLKDKEQRERVYGSWNAFRYQQPDLVEVRKKLFRYKIRLRMFFGKHDKVIVPKLAEKLSGDYVKHAKVHYLDKGHDLIKEEVANEIRGLFLEEV